MRAHEFARSATHCDHCGGAKAALGDHNTCVWRPDMPASARPIPPSIFDDLASIGERMKHIRAEEDAARAGSGSDAA